VERHVCRWDRQPGDHSQAQLRRWRDEFSDRHYGVGHDTDTAKHTYSDTLVAGMRFVVTDNHVATTLTAEHEACTFQRGPGFLSGQIGRKFDHA